VVSRYFDAEPVLLTRLVDELKPRSTTIWTDSGVTTMTAECLAHPAVRTRKVAIKDCQISDEGHHQPLHAKAIAILDKQDLRLAFGSANFTTAGLLSTALTGNVETMVV